MSPRTKFQSTGLSIKRPKFKVQGTIRLHLCWRNPKDFSIWVNQSVCFTSHSDSIWICIVVEFNIWYPQFFSIYKKKCKIKAFECLRDWTEFSMSQSSSVHKNRQSARVRVHAGAALTQISYFRRTNTQRLFYGQIRQY